MTADGRPYPDFLLEHIAVSWKGVQLAEIDPDICLKVDSSLSYFAYEAPSTRMRQFLYLYHQSHDFDHETVRLLLLIGEYASDASSCWDELLDLEFQRDCGLSREDYLLALNVLAEHAKSANGMLEELLTA